MEEEEAECCIICLDTLNDPAKSTYSLPECSHCFHQTCINHWFRQGNKKCPLCNNLGIGNKSSTSFYSYSAGIEKFRHLRKLSHRKGAPKDLVNEIKKIKKREAKIRAVKNSFKQWKNIEVIIEGETLKVRDIINYNIKTRRRIQYKDRLLRRSKSTLSDKLNIIPLIIAEKKVLD